MVHGYVFGSPFTSFRSLLKLYLFLVAFPDHLILKCSLLHAPTLPNSCLNFIFLHALTIAHYFTHFAHLFVCCALLECKLYEGVKF